MENSLVVLEITGKDIPRFIRSLYKKGIRFYHLSTFNHIAQVTVSYSDYQKIKDIPTIYEIRIIKYCGLAKILKFLQIYKVFLISLMLGIFFLYFLCNIIFDVEVIHDKKEIRNFILEELKEYHIHKFSFVKSFDKNEKIVAEILKKHHSKIEWMEIERIGTKYIIKVEERKTITKDEDTTPRDVIAKKKGTILSITATTGEVVKKIYDYVEAGDVLISGTIKNKETIKDYVHAEGRVFAETWYSVRVEVPYFYYEEEKTGKEQKNLQLKFLSFNKRLLSNFTAYDTTPILSLMHPFLPISISFQKEEEIKKTEVLYSYERALLKAQTEARQKLLERLGKDDKIIYEKSLKNYEEDSKIIVETFFKVKEDITSYMEITEPKEENIQKE